ncbi:MULTISPECIES: imm11 family protein [Sorangium]|uniref:Immunity MXAN-0049 protein domain-containing protein n=1 Tax=Sorangium atrum TaxID=2995308 RepID=A0ABT5BTW6_9BACT|nr:DUF1629 domain-containing protein [Sorangium aterium]MDC0677163.1 hypothetical protein [Sorangium aterium]
MSFLLWRPGRNIDGICKILDVEGVEDAFELAQGVSRATGWPKDARCRMDPRKPKDIALADSLLGAKRLVVSGRVKKALEDAEVSNVELLPIAIINHKGHTASADYFIVNPQDVCDCIDVAQSGVKWNALDPDSICACDSLVLRQDVVPASYKVFRLHKWRNLVVIRRELADSMLAQGLSGLSFIEPSKYTGLG